MMHDLVIRLFSKYLYKHNRTLANLHLISRRFYGLREMFETQLRHVRIRIHKKKKTVKQVTLYTFSRSIRHWYYIYQPSESDLTPSKSELIEWRKEVLRRNGDFYKRCGVENMKISRKRYDKQLVECITKLIGDPRIFPLAHGD